MSSVHSILIAGSTKHTLACAKALFATNTMQVLAVVTPEPKPIGRKQLVSPNPLHAWALEQNIPVVLVQDAITKKTQSDLQALLGSTVPELLLVVDFGYFVPNWLLQLPSGAPVNIHPSTLPSWRGSSPGQFVIWSGATNSSVSLIHMNSTLDQGDIYYQLAIAVSPNWTAAEYYDHCFDLVAKQLPVLLCDIAEKKTNRVPQPPASSTPVARKILKQDSFLPWEPLQLCLNSAAPYDSNYSELFVTALAEIEHAASKNSHGLLEEMLQKIPAALRGNCLHAAIRAFNPWPRVWTSIPTKQGEKRMQILTSSWNDNHIQLETVLVEGKNPAKWSQLQTLVQ